MKTVLVGTLSITACDALFISGYQAGYERYLLLYRHSALSDNGVYAFLSRTVNDPTQQDRYHAGYITGWYAALFSNEHTTREAAALPVLQEEV